MDSTAALEIAEVPERLLVIGGGYIGLELGTVYAALGSRVTLVEMTDGLLPGVDRDLVQPLARRLRTLFAAIHLSTKVTALRESGEHDRRRDRERRGVQSFDRVLVAVGRRPRSAGLGLEATRVRTDERGHVVDRHPLPHRRSPHLRGRRRDRRAAARAPRHASGQGGRGGDRGATRRVRQRGGARRRVHRPRDRVVRPHGRPGAAETGTAREGRQVSVGGLRPRRHPRAHRTGSPSSSSIPSQGACSAPASSAREPAS